MAVLHHGPGARLAAVQEADRIGTVLRSPVGDDGLKVAEAREIVQLLARPTLAKLGVVVVGPIDQANVNASDALLKSLEDPPSKYTTLVLWAHDLGEVKDTIRSRCFDRWAPGDPGDSDDDFDEELEQDARDMLRSVQLGNLWMIPEIAKRRSKETREMLRAIVELLATEIEQPENRHLWEQLRPVTRHRNLTMLELVAALLPTVT